MILLDTSVIVDALTGSRRSGPMLQREIARGERPILATLVLYEWLRGPRLPQELADQEALFPRELALPFGPVEAAKAADLYTSVARPRGREIDLAIAACALCWQATLWTLNVKDFDDIPGLDVSRPK